MIFKPDIEFQSFFAHSPCPMWILDNTTLNFIDVNEAAIKQYGYSREEFLTMRLPDMRAHGDMHNQQIISDLVQSRSPKLLFDAGTSLHKNKNGDVFYVHVYAQSIEFKGKEAGLAMLINDDARIHSEIKTQELNDVIKKQKEQIEDIHSTVNDVIWSRRVIDLKLVYINNASIDVYGYAPEELIGQEEILYTLVHPDDKEKLNAEIKNALIVGRGKIEYRIYHRDGTLKHIDTHAVVKKDADGNPQLLDGIAIDVTQLRQAESNLEKKANEVAEILESIKDGFFALDSNWNFTYVNKEFEKIYNSKREDIIGVNYWKKFPKAKHQKFYTEYHRVVKNNVNVYFEEYASSLNKWVSINAYPAKDGITVYFRDITEEKMLKEKIYNDERNLSALIDNTKDIIWSVNTELKIISYNQSFSDAICIATGVSPKAGDSVLHENYGEKLLNEWKDNYTKAFAGIQFKTLEETSVNDETTYRETFFNPILDKENKVIGVGCFSRDISEEKKYLQKIQLQNERLQQIAWIQSHKVRGPVASALGLIGLFDVESANTNNHEILQKLKETVQNLDEIIREIDTTTRLQA